MKIRTPYILLCLLIPALSSCIFGNIDEVMEASTDVEVSFALNVKSSVATKGLDGIDPLSIFVLVYDTEGNFVKEIPILNTYDDDGKVRFNCPLNVHLPSDASEATPPQYRFMVVTNSTNQQYGLTYDKDGVPAIEQLDYAYSAYKYSSGSTIPMWGVKTHTIQYEDGEVKEVQDLGVIDILRSGAKVSVELVGTALEEGYTIGDIKINHVAAAGYSVPGNWKQIEKTTDLKTGAAGYVLGFRPNNIDPISDVNAFFPAGENATKKYIYIPEITNDQELAISLVLHKNGETFEFTYDKGIKFAEYDDAGLATENRFNVIRNNHYEYKIRAVHTNLELLEVEYNTLPMIEEDIEIGGEVKYLVLNTDLVQIYGENIDASTLQFTSSSPIRKVELKDTYGHDPKGSRFANQPDGTYAYYVSKFGQRVQLGTDPGFDIEDKEAALAREQVILDNITATAQAQVLQGNIMISSPFMGESENEIDELKDDSHYDTVRYLEFEVTNEQGLTATFRVEQYPPLVITNIEGYFSYRSDQKLTDDWEEASHYHNYRGSESFHLTGLYFYHEHEWSKEFEMTDEWWAENRNERDYSWVVPKACPSNHLNDGCETVHYGNIGNPVTWYNSKGVLQNKVYGGLYRPTQYPDTYFYRWRYNGIGASNNDSQGLSIGDLYQKEDGKWYRKHYVWNVNPIFYNLYVGKVYKADEDGKLKGQADLYSMTHATTTYKDEPGTGWAAWGKQKYTNHRMYYIRTNTTSPDYVLAKVDLVDREGKPTDDAVTGITANTKRNANVLSPSFMVASQLGETSYQSIVTSAAGYGYKVPVVGEFYKLAEEHCREYVETTFEDLDGDQVWDEGETVTHYNDWRLPTKAEINLIISAQEKSRAMDRLLVGQYYFCAAGGGENGDINVKDYWVSNQVPGYTSTMTGYYIRCVRDVYED